MDSRRVLKRDVLRPIFTRLLRVSIDQLVPPRLVFGRFACLGRAMFARTFRDTSVNLQNHQKLRIDGLVDLLTGNELVLGRNFKYHIVDNFPISDNLKTWISEMYSPNVHEQIRLAQLFFFDSFSDYTDRLFREISSNITFFAHRADLLMPKEFSDLAYLSIESIENNWITFLTQLQSINPAPVIMTHYSSRFDNRVFFQRRNLEIRNVYRSLEGQFDNFHFIELVDSSYELSGEDKYPYHYSIQTINTLTSFFKTTITNCGIKPDRYLFRID